MAKPTAFDEQFVHQIPELLPNRRHVRCADAAVRSAPRHDACRPRTDLGSEPHLPVRHVRSFKRTEPMLGELSMKPSDYLRRQVRVTPFPGEDVAELVKISSPELYLFSSDYPHPEGTKDPIGHFERSFDEQGIDQQSRDAFYEGNYKTLMGV